MTFILAALGFYAVFIVTLAVLIGHSSTGTPPATPVAEPLPPMDLIDIDVALLLISVIPAVERTREEWEQMDWLMDERFRLAPLPARVRASVPVIPGWSA